jgi:parvulin-like peptidyl-prolyl isomerase
MTTSTQRWPRWRARAGLLSLAGAFTVTVAAPGDSSNPIIAKGGSVELGSSDVRALVSSLPESTRSTLSTNLPALEQLIRNEILRRSIEAEAKAKSFEEQPEIARTLQRIREEAVFRLWVADHAAVPPGYPNDGEVQAAYEAARKSLRPDSRYHLAMLFISAGDGAEPAKLATALHKALDLQGKLATGDFGQIAREQSEDPETAQKGGDLGFMADERIAPGIAPTVRTMKVGQVAGPVKTSQGLYFIKLIEKKEGAVPTLADIRERLVVALRSRRAEELQQAYLNDLGNKLGIAVNQIELAKLQPGLK